MTLTKYSQLTKLTNECLTSFDRYEQSCKKFKDELRTALVEYLGWKDDSANIGGVE
jgi:hypothetical protein